MPFMLTFPDRVPVLRMKELANFGRLRVPCVIFLIGLLGQFPTHGAEPAGFAEKISPLFKNKCVKCHGPAKAEAKLDLSTAAAVLRGGENGPIVAPHQVEESLLWERVQSDEMPPKEPLTADEKNQIKLWIEAGLPGLPFNARGDETLHWAFRKLKPPTPPVLKSNLPEITAIDRFLYASVDASGELKSNEAPRQRLIRRVSLTLTGLPPGVSEIQAYLNDSSPNAYTRMVERYLASPRYGERWGKYWLDAAGYADSNGYFNADTDRPLAYRYRDYVIGAFNDDMPFDQFLTEQIAGDELPGFTPGQPVTSDVARRLVATHFLRNGQDGSGESDGNPDEVRVDRYTALESCQQIVATSLLGLTIQCAKCHSHKFEPISHEDYYRFQAIFAPVFPAATDKLWIKPQARFVLAPTESQKLENDTMIKQAEADVAQLQSGLNEWMKKNRPVGELLFYDDFNIQMLSPRWSNTAPGDDKPGGSPAVVVDSTMAPAARVANGRLEIIAGKTLDSWLTIKRRFDWTPENEGDSIQVTFDLVANRLAPDGKPAERVGYFIATHDFDDDGMTAGGNILIDGHPNSSSSVIVDYPGKDSKPAGAIGRTGYIGGRNYGVRVTNTGKGEFRLEHLLDGFPDDGDLKLKAADLPDGGFGFEYHADRSFIVDNVRVEAIKVTSKGDSNSVAARDEMFRQRQKEIGIAAKRLNTLKNNPPFKIAWASDVTPNPPATHLLERGDYARPSKVMEPLPLSVLATNEIEYQPAANANGITTGRRLALARWLTDPKGRAASLLARVQVNRIWQYHFGVGIVTTPENFGLSGAPPIHPELLDWLASELIRSGWSVKHVHRLILNSMAFRRSSDRIDENNLNQKNDPLKWPFLFPAYRLDAEAIRDSMLAVSGELDLVMGGPYVPVQVWGDGAVVIAENASGGRRRSVYLQQRRTQVVSMMQTFDSPTIVFNSLKRARTAMPLQSLTLMNSEFVRARAAGFADRVIGQESDEMKRVELAYLTAYSRLPGLDEIQVATAFLTEQRVIYGGNIFVAGRKAWVDFCQAMLMSNEFLYID